MRLVIEKDVPPKDEAKVMKDLISAGWSVSQEDDEEDIDDEDDDDIDDDDEDEDDDDE